MHEVWAPVLGHEGRYEVSNLGRVRTLLLRPGIKKQRSDHGGYMRVGIVDPVTWKTKMRLVHQLVIEAFIGPRPEGMVVRHADGTRDNNHLSNLSYGTPQQNTEDMIRHGRHRSSNTTHCPKGHPYDEANTRIRPNGSRLCRTCHRVSELARYHAAKDHR